MTFLRVMFPRLFVALLLTSPVDLKGRHTGLVAAAYLRSSRVARAPSSHYVHVDSQAIRSLCPGYHRTRGTLFPAGRPGSALPSGGPLDECLFAADLVSHPGDRRADRDNKAGGCHEILVIVAACQPEVAEYLSRRRESITPGLAVVHDEREIPRVDIDVLPSRQGSCHPNASPHNAQMTFPPAATGYHDHRSLIMPIRYKPRPLSASSSTSAGGTGGCGKASQSRISTLSLSESSHSRTVVNWPKARDACTELVTSSETTSAHVSLSSPRPHSHVTSWACSRAHRTAPA